MHVLKTAATTLTLAALAVVGLLTTASADTSSGDVALSSTEGTTHELELALPRAADADAQAHASRRLCVCWGPCCAHCLGYGCPRRRRLEEEDARPSAIAALNLTTVECIQRSWGLECPSKYA